MKGIGDIRDRRGDRRGRREKGEGRKYGEAREIGGERNGERRRRRIKVWEDGAFKNERGFK